MAETTTTFSTKSPRSDHTQDPLFSYLAADPRPSFVLAGADASLIYANDAYLSWLASCDGPRTSDSLTPEPNLHEWYASISQASKPSQASYVGLNWLSTAIQPGWIVVTSLETPQLPQLQIVHNSVPTAPTPSSSPKTLDWTRHDIKETSDHIALVKSFPWQSTDLGHIESWSDTLRQIVLSMMANPTPQILLWGSTWTMIYNEACVPMFGEKHPASLGNIAKNVWQEAMVMLGPLITGVMTQAKGIQLPGMPVIMHRHGYDEETIWTINLTPVIGSCGTCLGVVDQFTDNTEYTVRERRRKTAADFDTALAPIRDLPNLWSQVLESLKQASADVPLALLYTSRTLQSGGATVHRADLSPEHTLHAYTGLEDPTIVPHTFDASKNDAPSKSIAAACQEACRTRATVTLRADDKTLLEEYAVPVPAQPGSGNKVNAIFVTPLFDISREACLGFLVMALNPNRPIDDAAMHFIEELGNITRNYAQAIFFPQAQNRLLRHFEEVETDLEQQVRHQQDQAHKIGARVEKIFKMAPIGVFSINPEGRCVFFNDAYLRIAGVRAQDFEDPTFRASTAIHDDDRDRIRAVWQSCLEDHHPISVEYRMTKPSPRYNETTQESIDVATWVYATATCEVDEHGDLVMVTGFLVDITERKWNEEQDRIRADAERTEAPFRKLAESAPMGMYHLRADGTPIYVNDAYFELAAIDREYEQSMRKGMDWSHYIFEEDVPKVRQAWIDLVETGTPLNLEYRVKKPWKHYDQATGRTTTGTTWLQGTAIADRDAQGRTQTVLGFVTEISDKKFSETLLAERLEEALETKRQADRFIDMTSHEMRNPLSAILQSADAILTALIEDGMTEADDVVSAPVDPAILAETVVDATQTIILCAQHQKRIVDDILTLSKLDTKLLVIVPDKASPVDLLNKSIKMYEAEIRRAEVDVALKVERSYHDLHIDKAMLDSSRLLQVVINLLTNAVKFTQRSSNKQITIYLGGSASPPTESFHHAAFVPQKSDRIDPTDSSEWGTGEVAYVQVAVEDSGVGLSPDELKVMFQRFAQASPKTYKQYGGSGLGLFISRELTELQGGQIGVHSESGKGSTFTFYIKVRRCVDATILEDDCPTSPLRSTSVMAGQRTNSLQPVRSHSATSERRPSIMVPPPIGEASSRTSRSGLMGLHILIVEDNVINQRVMASQLRRMGCTVHIAHHGAEALQFLGTTAFWDSSKAPGPSAVSCAEHDKTPTLDLSPTILPSVAEASTPPLTPCIPLSVILMDLEMPVLGGLDTVREIRRLERLGHIRDHVPVIAITANARSEQIMDAVKQGMDSVVTKPFRVPDLLPLIENVLIR